MEVALEGGNSVKYPLLSEGIEPKLSQVSYFLGCHVGVYELQVPCQIKYHTQECI